VSAKDVHSRYYEDDNSAYESDRKGLGKRSFLPSMPRIELRKRLGIPPAKN
jgi:hypothetical protein